MRGGKQDRSGQTLSRMLAILTTRKTNKKTRSEIIVSRPFRQLSDRPNNRTTNGRTEGVIGKLHTLIFLWLDSWGGNHLWGPRVCVSRCDGSYFDNYAKHNLLSSNLHKKLKRFREKSIRVFGMASFFYELSKILRNKVLKVFRCVESYSMRWKYSYIEIPNIRPYPLLHPCSHTLTHLTLL